MNNFKKQLLDNNELHLEIPITFDCNLKCKNCKNFSNIINEHIEYPLKTFKSDIEYLNKINANLKSVIIYGGEPLLNKNLFEYINIIRLIYNNRCKINILTNGVRLDTSDEFIDNLLRTDAHICVNVYPPFKDKVENIIKFYKSKGVLIHKTNNEIDNAEIQVNDKFRKTKFRINNPKDQEIQFNKCKGDLLNLFMSNFYVCSVNMNVKHVNKRYNSNFKYSFKSIYDFNSNSDIVDFCKTSSELCKICFMPYNDYEQYKRVPQFKIDFYEY